MRVQPADGFAWVETEHGPALVCRPLAAVAAHLFTTRAWPLGSSEDGWGTVAGAMGVPPARLARLHQVHGASVVVAREALDPRPDADVIVTDDPALALAIQTADCVPLLIADARTGVVAAAHAGWRGLAAGVPRAAVGALTERYGSRAADLIAAVGPSISAARYEVGEDVRARFEASGSSREQLNAWFPAETRAGHWLFDGWQSARDQLEAAGLSPEHVHVARLCTAESADLFCSYRRDGKHAGRLAAAIRTRNPEP